MESTTIKRPLESLTDAECQALYALAFGYAPPLDHLGVYVNGGRVIISGPSKSLFLFPDGQAGAQTEGEGRKAAFFNAHKVIAQLRHLNVIFGASQ